MDLLDFEGQDLYFDEPLESYVAGLIREASLIYGKGNAERPLLRAYSLAPKSLTVLVALYRFYFYQHRYTDALTVATRAMEESARQLGMPRDWQRLTMEHMGAGAMRSMGLVRFYLMALKAAGYLHVRQGQLELAKSMFLKIIDLDKQDRLGVKALLELVEYSAEANEPARKVAAA